MFHLVRVLVVTSGLTLLGVVAEAAPAAEGKIVVLVAGVNQSVDPGLAPLQYAEGDAEKFARTILQTAGDGEIESKIGRSPSLSDFRSMMTAVSADSKQRPLGRLVFYFSGHSDDRGLHFRDGFLAREELHAWLDDVRAETKLIVIDACFSGSMAAKGAEPASEFELPRLDLDRLTGIVYLTASSSREVAYESDDLGGSVFTHYLVTGLSGAGDLNADSLVTVEELYQYVYREMQLRNMSLPNARSQRPEIHLDLHGRGALVVARPRSSQGNLFIDPGILGTIQIASLSGIGSVSVYSGGLKQTEVKLPAGQYRAVILRGNRVGEARIDIGKMGGARLLAGDFQWHDSDGTAGLTKGSLYSVATVSAMVGLRVAADRTSSAGPEVELTRTLGTMPGSLFSAKALGVFTFRQLRGESAEEKLESYSGTAGIGLSFGRTQGSRQRFLLGYGQAAEWQQWEGADGERVAEFTPHPTLTMGLDFDLEETGDSKNLALRYDSDYVTDQATRTSRRRDSYLLGMGFKP